jgi:hypothetical protein
MNAFRRILIATMFSIVTLNGAQATSTLNFTDQWMVPTEPGWGASVHQQADILFIDLAVYGADSKPTWFVAAAWLQRNAPEGHIVFIGDLFATTGPHFAGAFDPQLVAARKVGTLTFDAPTATSATISYTVDGASVVKNVSRLTWSYVDLSGTYYGGWNADRFDCNKPADNVPFDEPITMIVDHNTNDNSVVVTLQFADGVSQSFTGIYTQSGHLGRIEAEINDGAEWGFIFISEIEVTRSGFTGRFDGALLTSRWQDICDMKNGRIGGVMRD